MRKLDEKSYWEDLFELGEYLEANENGREVWKQSIPLFSRYIGNLDRQYLYNDTFLPLFTEQFLEFLHRFCQKYPWVIQLMNLCDGRKELELRIDRYWKIEGKDRGYRCCIYENSDYDFVLKEDMMIEAVLLIETKRFVLQECLYLSRDNEKDERNLEELKKKIGEWIKIHLREPENGENKCTK